MNTRNKILKKWHLLKIRRELARDIGMMLTKKHSDIPVLDCLIKLSCFAQILHNAHAKVNNVTTKFLFDQGGFVKGSNVVNVKCGEQVLTKNDMENLMNKIRSLRNE